MEIIGAPITLINKRKQPLATIQFVSGQNKIFASLGKESGNAIKSLIKKHQMTTKLGQPIVHIRKIELNFNGETIILTYKSSDKESELTKIDAIVRACDESLLVHDEYRRLVAVETSLIREYLIANRRVEITNFINKEIRIGTFDIDKDDDLSNNFEESDDGVIVDEASPAIINPGDTLKLKLGGDGYNVGRKQSHVMITFCLLNKEKYEDLAKIGQLFQHQLDLQNNGIYDKYGIHWPYFCLYCDCQSEMRWDMDQSHENLRNNACENRKLALFPAINQENYIPDELHLFLRIVDVLIECFFNDLIKKKEFEKKIKLEIEQEIKNINVHFEFFKSRSTGGKWNWTSLMGPDKKKVLEHFSVSQFISGIRGQDIKKLWREFFQLYKII
ncbi:13860_t:CDS:2 [Funneliformis mosseae]|uniref:13860_t:CDS:1 n=1 Tax=Funneliformis mosseae TaxID=27381 RepID=A0A9N9CII1_FUNMO|nr:13860_t:CDS:2 [Funneliformis mosseae]